MRIGGLVSGLDWNQLIDQLMELESRPVQVARSRQAVSRQRLQAWEGLRTDLQTLRSALDALKQPRNFTGFRTTSTNEDILTANAANNAQAGVYNIKVEQLATALSVRSAAPVAVDAEGALGIAGTFSLGGFDGEDLIEIEIIEGDTLVDLRNAINAVAAESGVAATIVDGHLILTRTAVGIGKITIADNIGLVDALNLAGETDEEGNFTGGADAKVIINGIEVIRGSNNISDAIAGVTLNLQATGDATVTVARDEEAILSNIKDFVSRYNAVLAKMRDAYDYDKNGPLRGDTTLARMTSNLRTLPLTSIANPDSDLTNLMALGIGTKDISGALHIDEKKLLAALEEDLDGVTHLFTAPETGLAARMEAALEQMAGREGIAASRVKYFESSIRDYDRQILALEDRLAIRERSMVAQFQAMERMISQMQSQGNFLNQFLLQNMMSG